MSRYVRGLGNLVDVNIAAKGYSRRAIDLEIITSNGTFHLKGGRIRSALRLNEQLFVINKRYARAGGQVASYNLPAAAGATVSGCASTGRSAWRKWASNTTP